MIVSNRTMFDLLAILPPLLAVVISWNETAVLAPWQALVWTHGDNCHDAVNNAKINNEARACSF